MQFGDILRQLLDDNNLTQKKLGVELNIAPTTIGNYVRNIREPDYETLKMIAAYFDVSTDYLLDHNSKTNSSQNESSLINIYRCLNEEYKEILIAQAKALYKTQKKR